IQLVLSKTEHFHTVFENYLDFYKYQLNIDPGNRCYFETIFGEVPQKLYFDIDINLEEHPNIDSEAVKDDLIKSVLMVLNDFGIDHQIQRDILVCTSHGPKKRSYHVILDNYFLPNNEHNRTLSNLIISKMNPENSRFIDKGMYKTLQQFRILGSQKKDSHRVKVFSDEFKFVGINVKYEFPDVVGDQKDIYLLGRTLITNIKYCKELPHVRINEIALKLNQKIRRDNFESTLKVQVTEEIAMKSIQKLALLAGMNIHDVRFPYRYKGINDNLILLKREKASLCKVCEVIHENEHPFMYINNKGNLYFDCRRSQNHGDLTHRTLYVGNFEDLGTKVIQGLGTSVHEINENDEELLNLTLDLNNMEPVNKANISLITNSLEKGDIDDNVTDKSIVPVEISNKKDMKNTIEEEIKVSKPSETPKKPNVKINWDAYYKFFSQEGTASKVIDSITKLDKHSKRK
ncbi:MAG TPA: hypothetical protein VKR58_00715, partial [Aquella sp.]|nr:hypothetical protein [Aquella sp.]